MNTKELEKNKLANASPSLPINNGTLEALKWLALISMTVDHFNRFFLNSSSAISFEIGRIAMPLFAFIFAYNFRRFNSIPLEIYTKSIKRLILFGTLAIPAYMAMQHLSSFIPLNIMFMFLVCTNLFFLTQQKTDLSNILAIFLFCLSGFFVEYNWIGILLCFFWWTSLRAFSFHSLIGLSFAYWLLDLSNGNHWAMLSLPLIFIATQVEINLPRIPYLFYIYYPTHLSLFWLSTIFLKSSFRIH